MHIQVSAPGEIYSCSVSTLPPAPRPCRPTHTKTYAATALHADPTSFLTHLAVWDAVQPTEHLANLLAVTCKQWTPQQGRYWLNVSHQLNVPVPSDQSPLSQLLSEPLSEPAVPVHLPAHQSTYCCSSPWLHTHPPTWEHNHRHSWNGSRHTLETSYPVARGYTSHRSLTSGYTSHPPTHPPTHSSHAMTTGTLTWQVQVLAIVLLADALENALFLPVAGLSKGAGVGLAALLQRPGQGKQSKHLKQPNNQTQDRACGTAAML